MRFTAMFASTTMFSFTVLLLLGLMGVHIVNCGGSATGKGSEVVKLGVEFVLDLHYMNPGRDMYHATRYLKAFLDAVELRFSDMTDPKVKLFLTNIVQMDYPKQAKFYSADQVVRNELSGWGTRDNLHKVPKKNLFPSESDVILIMTGYNLWAVGLPNVEGNLTNSADQDGACTKDNVAVCEDDGATFSGVGSAAEAIAVLLGATRGCPGSAGHLLSSMTGVSSNYNLPSCGKKEIKEKLQKNQDRKRCLLKDPKIENSVKDVQTFKGLPFNFLGQDPCQRFYGLHSCKDQNNSPDCTVQCCLETSERKTLKKYDGTPCGNPKGASICSNGQCIRDPRN